MKNIIIILLYIPCLITGIFISLSGFIINYLHKVYRHLKKAVDINF